MLSSVLCFSLGVPYHSWRITHAKHHASTGHMQLDQVWVPKTRSQAGLSALDPSKEDINGASIADDVKQEFWEALGDSPIGACIGVATYFVSSRLVRRHVTYILTSNLSLSVGKCTLPPTPVDSGIPLAPIVRSAFARKLALFSHIFITCRLCAQGAPLLP